MSLPKRCLEYIVLSLAMVATAGAVIAAVFTEIKFMDLSDGERRIIQALSEANDQNELFLRTEATAGIVFATAGIAFLIGAIAMIGRICNARHEKTTYRVFSCLYLLYILFCFLGFVAAGVLGVFTAMDWFDIDIPSLAGTLQNEVENLRNSVAATAACSLFAALIFAALEVIVLFCCSADKHY